MIASSSRSFYPVSLMRAIRVPFYYALLAFLYWQMARNLLGAYQPLRQLFLFGDRSAAMMLIMGNLGFLVFSLEAGLIFLQDRSFARASFVRLMRFSPGREADLLCWNLYPFLIGGLVNGSVLTHVLPLFRFNGLPGPFGLLAFLLASSFAQYVVHWLCHRVPFLWELHKVHHSVTELNIATSQHDHFFTTMLNVLVLLSFGGPMDWVSNAVFVLWMVSDQLQHTSLDFRMGWLGYVFVSPHGHRIHHLKMPEYYNKNLGSKFALWDQLFGTFVYEVPVPLAEMEKNFGLEPAELWQDDNVVVAMGKSAGRSLACLLGRRTPFGA